MPTLWWQIAITKHAVHRRCCLETTWEVNVHIFLRNGLYVIAQCRQFMQWLELVGQFSLLSSIIAVDLVVTILWSTFNMVTSWMRDVKLPLRKQFPLFTNDSVDKFALGSCASTRKGPFVKLLKLNLMRMLISSTWPMKNSIEMEWKTITALCKAIASNGDKQMTDGSEASCTIVVKFHVWQSSWWFVSGEVNKFCLQKGQKIIH